MFSVLEQFKNEEARDAQRNRESLRGIIRKASAGDLSAADAKRLRDLLAVTATTFEDANTHIDGLKRDAEIENELAAISKAEVADADVAVAESRIAREWEAAKLAFQQRLAPHQAERARLANIISRRGAKEDERMQLRLRLRDYFGVLPADETKNRAHVVRFATSGRLSGPYQTIEFEQIMAHPPAFATEFGPDSLTEWCPAPGQSEEDLQQLLDLARNIIAENSREPHRIVRYLGREEYLGNEHRGVHSTVNDATAPTDAVWVSRPGQSRDEIAAMLEVLEARADRTAVKPGINQFAPQRAKSWLKGTTAKLKQARIIVLGLPTFEPAVANENEPAMAGN